MMSNSLTVVSPLLSGFFFIFFFDVVYFDIGIVVIGYDA